MPQQQQAAPSAFYVCYVVAALNIAYLFAMMDRLVLGLVIDPLRRDLLLNETQISLLLGFAFAMFYTVLGLPFGRLADRSNRRNLLAAGIALWSVATVACAFATDFWTLFIARMGVGFGEATIAPVAYSLIPDYVKPERRGLAMSIFAIGSSIGAGLSVWLGGYALTWATEHQPVLPLLGQLAPWKLAFVVVGLPGLVWALLMFLTVREPPRGRTGAGSHMPSLRETFRYLIDNRKAFAPVMFGFAGAITNSYVFISWGPVWLMRVHGMSPAEAGLVLAIAFGGIATIAMIVGGILSDRLIASGRYDAPLHVSLIGSLLALPCELIAYLSGSTSLAVIAFMFGVFFCTLYAGVHAVAIQNLTPNRMRGQMGALYLMIAGLISYGIGPMLTAALTDIWFGRAGMGWSMAITSAIALVINIVLLTKARAPVHTRASSILGAELA